MQPTAFRQQAGKQAERSAQRAAMALLRHEMLPHDYSCASMPMRRGND